MAVLQHVLTRSDGPELHTVGLGDVLAHEINGNTVLYTASAAGGGVLVRSVDGNLALNDAEDFGSVEGLDAARALVMSQIDGDTVLLSVGRYGDLIEGWVVNPDGTLGAQANLTLQGGDLEAVTGFVDVTVDGVQMFVTSSRHSDGLDVWTREGDQLRGTQAADTSTFLEAADVQGMALAAPNGVPYVLVITASMDDLIAFEVRADGSLGVPSRLDARDGLFIDTPTQLEVVELAGQTYAIVGAAGSSSISVVAINSSGQMAVTGQVNDTRDTFFNDLYSLETLEAEGHVFVLAAGSDNGLSLMTLQTDGSLLHIASLDDELRDMALLDSGGLEMIWRDGGLDIFVTGRVLDDTDVGRGITQLRVDNLDAELPAVQWAPADLIYHGTAGADVFVLADTDTKQRVYDFETGVDRLDMSAFGQFYDVEDLSINTTSTGAQIRLDGALVQLYTDDGASLGPADFTAANTLDLWRIDVAADVSEPLALGGTLGSNFLDGRDGDDVLLAEGVDEDFDPFSAMVFRVYQATLDRAPDVTGLQNWVARLDSGSHSFQEVVSGFTGSTEFNNLYGSTDNQEFVTLLYDNVLGREPDTTGLTNWSGRLDDGMTRAQVVVGFSESVEFKQNTEIDALAFSHAGLQADFADDVYRLYRATLDRDPDETGFFNWSDRLAEGQTYQSVASGFTNSAEFQNSFGETTNADFVRLLYKNVLDREPDATGLANWTARLDDGVLNRAQVVQGFAQSVEFIGSTKDDLIGWVKGQGVDDVLSGGGGNNMLMGGILSDTFVFNASNNGQNVIVDLESWDVVSLQGFGFDTATDVSQFLRTENGNVIFEDAGVMIEFRDVALSEVLSTEFEF